MVLPPAFAATPDRSVDNPALTGETNATTAPSPPQPVKEKKKPVTTPNATTDVNPPSSTEPSSPAKSPSDPAKISDNIPTNAAASIPPPPSVVKDQKKDDLTASLAITDLKDYAAQPEAVQHLIAEGLDLATLGLTYRYGSDDPKNGGMDCSGTLYYLLNKAGCADVPRDASGMYRWVWQNSRFESVVSNNPKSFEFDRLKPGDLLFWTGTYRVDHDPPVTHVMLYLGINRVTGHHVMFGASNGRTYEGKPRYGVSVFDFKLPSPLQLPSASPADSDLQSRFIGYGPIPGLDKLKTSGTAP